MKPIDHLSRHETKNSVRVAKLSARESVRGSFGTRTECWFPNSREKEEEEEEEEENSGERKICSKWVRPFREASGVGGPSQRFDLISPRATRPSIDFR